MSHNKDEIIICPNCGYEAQYNYCAQCGQDTHLHQETFWGLIMHFIGHYFHYDSKFWQTIKTLVTKPGQLTVAYWNRQRARYIPPISLYIFISTLYFLIVYVTMPATIKTMENTKLGHMADSTMAAKKTPPIVRITRDAKTGKTTTTTTVRPQFKSITEAGEMVEKISHQLPKVYFFMVPFLALLLKLLFLRRKDLYFVDHAIYSLHFHSAAFLAMLTQSVLGSIHIIFLIIAAPGFYIALFVYSVIALQKAYNISKGRAVVYTFFLGVLYALVVGIITMALLVLFFKDVFIY